MEKTVTIPLSSLSLNNFLYKKGDYRTFHKNVKEFATDYFDALPKASGKVALTFTSFFKNECDCVDPDNTIPTVKALIDALKSSEVIPDDNYKYVESVTLKTRVNGEHKIEILICYL